MEGRQRAAELVRVAAHLVERNQAVVDVEGRVFGAFGHDRPGRLLEAGDEIQKLPLILRLPGDAQQQRVADEIKDGRVGPRVTPFGLGDGLLDGESIGLRRSASRGVDIGPIDAERGDHFADHKGEAVQREVAVTSVAAGDVAEEIAELVDLTGERDEHDHLLGRVGEVGEALRALAQEAEIDRREELLVLSSDEDPVQDVQEVVARRATDGPIRPQLFVRLEDLFDDDIEAISAVRGVSRAARIAALAPCGFHRKEMPLRPWPLSDAASHRSLHAVSSGVEGSGFACYRLLQMRS